MPDNSLRVAQKTETTVNLAHEQLELWSAGVPSSISEDHPLQAGPTEGLNIRLGADIIQALNGGVPVTLHLNPEGDGVDLVGDFSATGNALVGGSLTAAGLTDTSGANRGINKAVDGDVTQTWSGTTFIGFNSVLPVCDLTFVAPLSGVVFLLFFAKIAATGGGRAQVGVEVYLGTDATGTQVQAASTIRSIETDATTYTPGSWLTNLASLTPGSTYYARLMQRTSTAATTGTAYGRSLVILPKL